MAVQTGLIQRGRDRTMDRAEIRRLVESVPHWHHAFHFPGGISTNGGYDPRGLLDQIELPDLTGQRVLDVGTRDGFFAFACERAGAREVVAVDHVDPEVTGFEVARRILGSKVEYARENIYQISREKYGSFDLILFLGVLYHLRDPLLALDRLRSVCDGRMVVESLVCDTRFFTGFEQSTTLDAIAPALASIPIAQFLPAGRFHIDTTNKWVPNLAGLIALVEDAGFSVPRSAIREDRGLVHAEIESDPEKMRIIEMDRGLRDAP